MEKLIINAIVWGFTLLLILPTAWVIATDTRMGKVDKIAGVVIAIVLLLALWALHYRP